MWSIAVSGSEDGTAVIWDLNRAMYVRTIDHRDPLDATVNANRVHLVAINESTVSDTWVHTHKTPANALIPGLYCSLFNNQANSAYNQRPLHRRVGLDAHTSQRRTDHGPSFS